MPIQLADGASIDYPTGDLQVILSAPAGAMVTLVGPGSTTVQPRARMSDTTVLFRTSAETVTVEARTVDGQPFADGSKVGLSIRSVGRGGEDVVRPSVEAGGRVTVPLIRLHPDGRLEDAFGYRRDVSADTKPARTMTPRVWHRTGSYAYHANHTAGAATQGAWALVLDGSASMLARSLRPTLGMVLEAVFAISAAARGGRPEACLVSGQGSDFASVFDADSPDWGTEMLGHPSAWSRLTPQVRAAADQVGSGGLVLIVLDGPPVDTRDLLGLADDTDVRLCVLAMARSRAEVDPANRPAQEWDEELAALLPLTATGRHTLVSLSRPEQVSTHLRELADALYPARR